MEIHFHKYEGAGNDFIMLDNRDGVFSFTQSQIEKLCNRHFGIGADGLILLENEPGFDFKMVYYNSDGRISSMCGNGGRCIAQFAKNLGIKGDSYRFLAADGPHDANFEADLIRLQMKNVQEVETGEDYACLNTGSPHWVQFVNQGLETLEIVPKSREIRNSERFIAAGINVNWVLPKGKELQMRTYERGVENETLACGTGVTAAAIAAHALFDGNNGNYQFAVSTPGGRLSVNFHAEENRYTNVWLTGPAKKVFSGSIEIF